MRALVLGVTTLALSAGAALAQAPAQDVYPSSGYAPYGYGYAPYGYGYAAPAPMFDYSGPAYGYSAPGYGYSGGPTYDYSGPAYGAATGQPPVAAQTVRHHRSVSASGSNSSRKGDLLKTGGTNGGY